MLEPRPDLLVKSPRSNLRKNPAARRDMMAEVDLVVLCLPDDAAREANAMADELGPDAPKVLDASTAHRVDPGWTYGFPDRGSSPADRRRTQSLQRSAQEATVRRGLHERVLEGIDRLRWCATLEHQLGRNKATESGLQLILRETGRRAPARRKTRVQLQTRSARRA
jgi:hypothetical protein